MRIVALISIFFVLCLIPSSAEIKIADVIFKNGNIYTLYDCRPLAEAVGVKDGRIIYVGSNNGAKLHEGKDTRIIDLHGSTVVPGMSDSHYHLSGVGRREMTLNLEGTASLEDFLAKVKARVDQAKPGEWITGRGWIETFWKPPVFPTRSDLDKVSPNNPIFLSRADGHGAVANSAALKLAGINKETPNPFGGEILKEKQTGEPTGMLLDRAQEILTKNIPPITEADAEQAILLGVKRSIELGWCQIQDAGGSYNDVDLMKKLYGEGKIKLRIYKAVHGPNPNSQKLLGDGATVGAFNNRFTLRTIKVVFDGALGSRGAALLEPYSDFDTSGFLTSKEEELMPMFEEALRQGIQVETHAIGDRANRLILQLYEKAFAAVPPDQRKVREPRWRVEHAQIVAPSDIPLFAKLGVIPSMQPSHAISDLHFAPSRLGIKRLEGAYAWQNFIKAGSIIAGGSDAPVERGEPMIEFYAAVARKDQKGFLGEGWHPEQAMAREQALKMFTIWSAYAAFEENLRGSLEPGKLADLTVLSADIMKIPEAEILKTRCVMTVIGGEVVFEEGKR
jgi:predicted amidohydrolase YtcJ